LSLEFVGDFHEMVVSPYRNTVYRKFAVSAPIIECNGDFNFIFLTLRFCPRDSDLKLALARFHSVMCQ
jgi:hypothetical protein